MNKKIDPLTKVEFTPVKANQKFQSKENQIKHSNLVAKANRELKKPILNMLDKSWKSALRLLGDKNEVTKSIDFMRGAGVDPTYFTHWVDHEGKPVRSLYDLLIIILDNGTMVKIKKIK